MLRVRTYIQNYVYERVNLVAILLLTIIACYSIFLSTYLLLTLYPLLSPLSSLLSPLSSLFSSPTPRLHSLTYTLTDTHTHTHQVMVFLPTARQTGYLAELFNSVGMEVMEIHSRKSQVGRILCSRNI